MTDRSDDIARQGSDARFRRQRAALTDALGALLGPRAAAEPLASADLAASLAAEARAGYRAAEEQGWAVVRHVWPRDDRAAVVGLLHAVSTSVGSRAAWLIVPGREPQAVALPSDVILDNPLGFAALGEFEFVLLDQTVPAGLSLARHAQAHGEATSYAWEVEAWGAEPWLSATTRAVREQRGAGGTAG